MDPRSHSRLLKKHHTPRVISPVAEYVHLPGWRGWISPQSRAQSLLLGGNSQVVTVGLCLSPGTDWSKVMGSSGGGRRKAKRKLFEQTHLCLPWFSPGSMGRHATAGLAGASICIVIRARTSTNHTDNSITRRKPLHQPNSRHPRAPKLQPSPPSREQLVFWLDRHLFSYLVSFPAYTPTQHHYSETFKLTNAGFLQTHPFMQNCEDPLQSGRTGLPEHREHFGRVQQWGPVGENLPGFTRHCLT